MVYRLEIAPNCLEELDSKIQLYVPENPKYNLLRTSELSKDHELDSLESDDSLSNLIGITLLFFFSII